MSSDLLDDFVIKVARVTQEVAADVVCVLQTLEDVGGDRKLSPLSELCSLDLALSVDVLHPAVVMGGGSLIDVLLEDHDI